MMKAGQWKFWIDTGGTFTDCLAWSPEGGERRLKVLSNGSLRARVESRIAQDRIGLSNVPPVRDGFYKGFEIRDAACGVVSRVLDWNASECLATVSSHPRATYQLGSVVDLYGGEEAPVLAMRMLAGIAPGEPFPPAGLRIATTRGTNALLEGKTAVAAFFVTSGFGDLLRIGDQRRLDLFSLNPSKLPALHGPVVEVNERLAADGSVLRPLNLETVREPALKLLNRGVNVAAIALLHSYRNPNHERELKQFLLQLGFRFVSTSSDLAPFIRIVPRAATAVVDAILSPIMEEYLDAVGKVVDSQCFHVMTSAGGVTRRSDYRSKDSLLGGPAGGVAGAASVARRAGFRRVLGFDMGGTSTDVARFEGDFDYQFEHTVGPARVFAPALRLETVAAGGGSICRFDGSALVVGPESAGAEPGPACYGAGGPLTLTDVNLLLGRLSPDLFGVPVFPEAAEHRLKQLVEAVSAGTGNAPSREEVLKGFLDIADERMADAIRRISVREGYDPSEYALVAFGGAGGLHACAVAGRLDIPRVLFPSDSGLLSAFGLKQAVCERFAEQQVMRPLKGGGRELMQLLERLETEAQSRLEGEGLSRDQVVTRRVELELRCQGQDSALVIEARPLESIDARFLEAYRTRYGYEPETAELEVVTARVVVSEVAAGLEEEKFNPVRDAVAADSPELRMIRREEIKAGNTIRGPAVVQDRYSTLYVARGWEGVVGTAGSILLENKAASGSGHRVNRPEVVELELFTCRFLSLVEEMGVLLQRCALSVNVKDRLDFSCGLLDAGGELVANAPHIPVHLGALGMCVRSVRDRLELRPGDVVVTNHPGFGGSHLPDVTLLAPVHSTDGRLIGYVANRAHHAEMGGIRPGSMPPDAHCLAEEGVVIPPTLLVRGGKADWAQMRRNLSAAPHPSRAIQENLADLHAQLASIHRGVEALGQLTAAFGIEQVCRFMELLKARSAETLAAALNSLPEKRCQAVDTLDDGTRIAVSCEKTRDGLVVDFSGSHVAGSFSTGNEPGDSSRAHPGNLNATPAIVHSAVIYVLRLLAGQDLPLNEGLLRNVRINIPSGLLSPEFSDDPRFCPAVVGGNVETSQRIVDVLVRAFGLAACSQGTMNNVTFGGAGFSCYETIGGGAGATAKSPGCDAVHVHMTNTAITDPEVMEARLPVRLERFAIRADSGGAGRHRGGHGIQRRIRFLEPAELSLLTQRRVQGPPGARGGEAGKPGRQWILRTDGSRKDLDHCAATMVEAGDELVIETPGGGGWGEPGESRGASPVNP